MKLAYQAMDGSGKTVSGTVEALDMVDAIEGLRRDNLFVTQIEPAGEDDAAPASAPATRRGRWARLGKGRRLKYLAMFFRQLYVLVSTGTQVVQALGALERQARDPIWRGVLTD